MIVVYKKLISALGITTLIAIGLLSIAVSFFLNKTASYGTPGFTYSPVLLITGFFSIGFAMLFHFSARDLWKDAKWAMFVFESRNLPKSEIDIIKEYLFHDVLRYKLDPNLRVAFAYDELPGIEEFRSTGKMPESLAAKVSTIVPARPGEGLAGRGEALLAGMSLRSLKLGDVRGVLILSPGLTRRTSSSC